MFFYADLSIDLFFKGSENVDKKDETKVSEMRWREK